jgi:glutamate-1-semialdehyde 2,1-aminomutase
MATMNVFLKAMQTPEVKDMYAQASQRWAVRLSTLNRRLEQEKLPVKVAGMETVWSILYNTPSRYNWMFQFYLRDQGIALSWVGSGRMIFNFGMQDNDFDIFMQRFVKAAESMRNDGWWWTDAQLSNRHIRQSVFKEILRKKYLPAQ